MQKLLTNGFTIIILPMKLVLLIKPSDMTMELDVHHKLNAKIVFLTKVVGLNKGLKFIQLINMERSLDKRT